MELPYGITGFYKAGDVPPPKVNERQFRQLCFEIIKRNHGGDIKFYSPEYPQNFYKVRFEIHDRQFYILLNEHYPYLAFALIVQYGNIQFIDFPDLSREFPPSYMVLKTSELSTPINQFRQNNKFNSAELEQIDWENDTVGQVIFNTMD